MTSRNPVEFADQVSRRRAIGTAAAAMVFLGVQLLTRPEFRTEAYPLTGLRQYLWAVNAGILILLVIPAGGWIFGRRVRELVNDEISRGHGRAATAAGFWLAMAIAIAIYVTPAGAGLTAREAVYLIVTPVAGMVPLLFSWLEAKAHRDG